LTFFSASQDNKDRKYLFKKKMVGKRLNKIIARCQLNWKIIDCVEELSVNFLTNTVQEENLNILVSETNKQYAPKFSKRNENNEVHELLEVAKIHLNEVKNFNLNEAEAQLNLLKGTEEKNQLSNKLEQLQIVFNEFEYDIVEDEDMRLSLDLDEEVEDLFNNIMEERRELLSRLEVLIENTNKLL
jgi:hypothetical protein